MGTTLSTTGVAPAGEKRKNAQIKLTVEQEFNVEDVIKAAEDAGKVIGEIYSTEQENWDVVVKSDDSPLTKADKAANEVICNALMKIAPHIPIISEENKFQDYDIRKNYQYCWCVDPLDGTKEFIKRNGQFTVNIALIRGDAPVLGVVHVPVWGSTYWAVTGSGAYLREPNKPETQLQVQRFRMSDSGLTVVASASHMSQETKDFVAQLNEPKFQQLGSSLKLLMVAEGKAHLYPRLAPTSEWDTAASHIIVLEAGGIVLQAGKCDNKGVALENWKDALAREEPLKYNKTEALNPFFVVIGGLETSNPNASTEASPNEEVPAVAPAATS